VAVFNPHQLWWEFERNGWDDQFAAAGVRMTCRCGATGVVSALHGQHEATVEMPRSYEREWKRAVNRFLGQRRRIAQQPRDCF
jgi:hypothetical protein